MEELTTWIYGCWAAISETDDGWFQRGMGFRSLHKPPDLELDLVSSCPERWAKRNKTRRFVISCGRWVDETKMMEENNE